MSTGKRTALVLATLWLAACSRRDGLNFDCAWVPDPPSRIDVRADADLQHLLDDIRVAEELGMRYGDRMAGTRLVEILGIVSRHGGTTNRDLGRQSRQQCVATLFGTIATTHGITVADIERVRPRLADRGLDLPITIPVALILLVAVRRFMRWIGSRFAPDEWAGWGVATLFASIVIPAIVITIGGGWAMVVEIIRLGNEHVGNRARIEGLRPHALAVLAVGGAAVWIGSGVTAMRKHADASRNQRASPAVE